MAAMTPAVQADSNLAPGTAPGALSGAAPRSGGRRQRKVLVFAIVVLAIAAVYFIGSIMAAFWFTIRSHDGFHLHAYTGFWQADGFAEAFTQSMLLALAAVVVTSVLIKLKLPRAKSLVEMLILIPLVVPPAALVVGVRGLITWTGTDAVASAPFDRFFDILQGLLALVYVVIAMPFTYRALAAGVQGVDLADPHRGEPQPRRVLVADAASCRRSRAAHRHPQRRAADVRPRARRVHDRQDP